MRNGLGGTDNFSAADPGRCNILNCGAGCALEGCRCREGFAGAREVPLEVVRASLLTADGATSPLADGVAAGVGLLGFDGSKSWPLDFGRSADVESSRTFAAAGRLVVGGAVRLDCSLRAVLRGDAAVVGCCVIGAAFGSATGSAALCAAFEGC